MSKEKLNNDAFERAIEWYEEKFGVIDVFHIPHPEDIDFDQCKEIFWEVEEEHEKELSLFEMKQALIDGYRYLNDSNLIEEQRRSEDKIEWEIMKEYLVNV